jgi:hypothetical protein
MKRLFRLGSTAAMILALPSAGFAQEPDLSHCTTANLLVGGAAGRDVRQPLFGGAVGWELTPHFALETTVKWLVPDRGAEAFSAVVSAQIPLTGRRTVVPFLTAGAGAHRASFDIETSRIPTFYARRPSESGTMAGRDRSFVDPAFVTGGGVSVFLSRHVSVRPEVEVMLLRHNSENYVLTSLGVRLAYHFETHRITSEGARR